ncbi:MAG: VOC family protein [Pseudomonadota bacterium]
MNVPIVLLGVPVDVVTFLTFDHQAADAAAFYTSIFPRSRIVNTTHCPAGMPQPEGSVMTVTFELADRPFISLNAGPSFSFSQGISLSVLCDAQSEVDCYWQRLLEDGGVEHACGWLTDRYGVSWQVNPKVLHQLMADPDPERRQRAMAAMMGMVKIDAQALLLAADGRREA